MKRSDIYSAKFGGPVVDPRLIDAVNKLQGPAKIIMALDATRNEYPASIDIDPTATPQEKVDAVNEILQATDGYTFAEIGPGTHLNFVEGGTGVYIERQTFTQIESTPPDHANIITVYGTNAQDMVGISVDDVLEIACFPQVCMTGTEGDVIQHFDASRGIAQDHFILIGRDSGGFHEVFKNIIGHYESTDTAILMAEQVSGTSLTHYKAGDVIIFTTGYISDLRSSSEYGSNPLLADPKSKFLSETGTDNPFTLIFNAFNAPPKKP